MPSTLRAALEGPCGGGWPDRMRSGGDQYGQYGEVLLAPLPR